MIGKIIGKSTTKNFSFKVEKDASKFQYVQVFHKDYGWVLSQITEIELEKEEIGHCTIIGFKKDGKVQSPRIPFQIGSEVLDAEDSLIRDVLSIEQKNMAYIGKLENRDIKIYLDLNKLLTKHISILAKTGAGKSYTAGILLEEIMEKKVPLLIIDAHGEYSQMRFPNTNKEDLELLKKEKIEPKGYKDTIVEYGDQSINESFIPLRLNDNMSAEELLHILPAKITQSQKATLYSVLKDLHPITLNTLIVNLSSQDDVTSVNLISLIDYMKSLNLFSPDYIKYTELIKPGKCSIINLKGIVPEIQEVIVYKLLKDLFNERKLGNIAPFFTVIEEAHNFAPERSFGESKASSIIRTIASEGRKFGLGLCLVTQRPARLDKNVLSQCSTQIVLKVTNPNDIKSIVSSVENVTEESEEEIKNLPIGTALVSGVTDIPLFVKIRPRRSQHGGTTVNILDESQSMLDDLTKFNKKELLPVIMPKTSMKDLKIIEGKDKISPILIPALILTVEKENQKRFNMVVEQIKGHIVANIDTKETIEPLDISHLSDSQKKLYNVILELETFTLAKLNEKTGVQILKLKDFLELFEKLNIIKKEDDTYQITSQSRLIKCPENFAFTGKMEFLQINYKSKLKAKIGPNEVKERMRYLKITDTKDCYLVYYKVE